MTPMIEPLAPHHDAARAAFSCGEPSLDTYLQRHAGQDVRRDLAACYVLWVPDSREILGYYTLSATAVAFTDLPSHLATKAGPYPMVPAVLLGRLVVDVRYQGQNLSTILLMDALRRIQEAGIGVQLVIVDALNEAVVAFYEKREFTRLADAALRLYLPMSRVRGLFSRASAPPAAAQQEDAQG